ncbi:hypothetical protein GJAV_G00274240 [Gymnothorax javanicus]|nr:hypothetical protein GJAV_G00274240 [Gymnothorax javanicus]
MHAVRIKVRKMEFLFCAVLALAITSSTLAVSRAEGDLPVLKGASASLVVPEYEEKQVYSITWKFTTRTILEYYKDDKNLKIFKGYKDMAEFNNSTLSLLLKNVQLIHSGIYTAEIKDHEGNSNVTTYTLSVEEAPPTPQVTVSILSSAGRFCNVSVNCSAEDTWSSYTCDQNHCTQVENTTLPTGVSLIVTATNWTIQCNSSNRVGTEKQTKSREDICQPMKIREDIPVSIIISITCFICVSIIITVVYRRRRRNQGTHVVTKINTEYATVESLQNRSTVETMYDVVTRAKPERPLEVNTVYHILGPTGDNSAKPETIYTTVNKSAA